MPLDESLNELESSQKLPDQAHTIEELPEEISVMKIQTRDGPKKVTTVKRVVKKKVGRKQSITEITTKTVQGQAPITTISVQDIDLPLEQVNDIKTMTASSEEAYEVVEELPEHIQITEVQTREGPVQKTIVKKQTIKKRKQGKREEVIEILTKQVDDKKPETFVTVSEIDNIVEETTEPLQLTRDTPFKVSTRKGSVKYEKVEEFKPELLQEFTRKSSLPKTKLPEEDKLTEVVIEKNQLHKKTVRRRVVKQKIVSETDEEIKRLITPIEHIEMIEDETLSTLDEVLKYTFITGS